MWYVVCEEVHTKLYIYIFRKVNRIKRNVEINFVTIFRNTSRVNDNREFSTLRSCFSCQKYFDFYPIYLWARVESPGRDGPDRHWPVYIHSRNITTKSVERKKLINNLGEKSVRNNCLVRVHYEGYNITVRPPRNCIFI